jgi:DNA-binding CsgD family transcriptional regulator
MAEWFGLSKREIEVAKLVQAGKSNKQIALALHITENTVEFHLKNIFTKLQVSSRTELVIKLGKSVVESQAGPGENRDKPSPGNWAAYLKQAVSKIGKEFTMHQVSNTAAHGAAGSPTFFDSIRVCLVKYADFNGLASQPEFWWFSLFVLLAASACTYLSQTLGEIFLIAVLLPFLAAGTRRLRDTGRSGWWQLFILVPVGGIVLLAILWSRPSAASTPLGERLAE